MEGERDSPCQDMMGSRGGGRGRSGERYVVTVGLLVGANRSRQRQRRDPAAGSNPQTIKCDAAPNLARAMAKQQGLGSGPTLCPPKADDADGFVVVLLCRCSRSTLSEP